MYCCGPHSHILFKVNKLVTAAFIQCPFYVNQHPVHKIAQLVILQAYPWLAGINYFHYGMLI